MQGSLSRVFQDFLLSHGGTEWSWGFPGPLAALLQL